MENNERSELSEALSLHSDMFKDVNGFRPRNMVEGWTLSQFETAIERLSATLTEQLQTPEERLAVITGERTWLTIE